MRQSDETFPLLLVSFYRYFLSSRVQNGVVQGTSEWTTETVAGFRI